MSGICRHCAAKTSAPKYTSCQPCRARNQVERACKQCRGVFKVAASRIDGKTNASGNFCSRQCYNRWLSEGKPTAEMGPLWAHARKEALRIAPFCGVCGTRHRLQVHHILPRRKGGTSEQPNLIPLCVKHHKHVETVTTEALKLGDAADIARVIGVRLRIRQAATASVLGGLRHAA